MKSTFLCIEPIHLNNDDIIKLFGCKPKYNILKEMMIDNPAWIQYYKQKNSDAYNNIVSMKLSNINQNLFTLPDHLPNVLDSVERYLLLDTDLVSFILCTEVKLDYNKLSLKEFKKLLSNNKEEENLHDLIKNILTKKENDVILSPWVDKVHKNLNLKIKEICKRIYSCNISNPIEINESLANITHFLDLEESGKVKITEEDKKDIKLLALNLDLETDNSELKNSKPLYLYKDVFYFNSNFNTVISFKSENMNKYYQIIFQMKYNWDCNVLLFNIYKEINLKIINQKQDSPFTTKEKVIKDFISKVFLFKLKNETFERLIKDSKPDIYNKIEKTWNIRESIEHTMSYIIEYNEYLSKEKDKYFKRENDELTMSEKLFAAEKDLEILKKVLKEYLGKNRKLSVAKKETEVLKGVLKDYLGKSRKLKENTFKDELTRASNRRKLYIDMQEHMVDNFKPFHLSFIDGDHFKDINDDYGHQAGDEVLKKMVDVMYTSLRENEIDGDVYRYGGEEFIILIFGERNISSLGVLNYIKSEIETSIIEYNGQEISFTVSLGAVKGKKGETIEEIIEEADELVYLAKENGRNRIEYSF